MFPTARATVWGRRKFADHYGKFWHIVAPDDRSYCERTLGRLSLRIEPPDPTEVCLACQRVVRKIVYDQLLEGETP